MKKNNKKENTKKIITALRLKSKEKKQGFWKDIAERLEKPRRIHASVNLEKIEKLKNKHGDKLFIVPGKIIGELEKESKIKVSALSYSKSALKSITEKKGNAYNFNDLLEMEVKSNDVLIIQ